MKKLLFTYVLFLVSATGFAQQTILKAPSLNRMLDLLTRDSLSYFRGEEKSDPMNGTYNVSTLPAMGKYAINISERPQQAIPLSFFIEVPVSKGVSFAKVKAELTALVKAKKLKYNMKVKENYEYGILALGDGVLIIHILNYEGEGNIRISVYRDEKYE
ncbi:MAG TPA: hypothetical protein PLL23_08130 [Chitinophagaceae bacterium]|nr:hypothetical protein [Chitinophagaceae bacterium]